MFKDTKNHNRSGDPRKRREQEWKREIRLAAVSVWDSFQEVWGPHLSPGDSGHLLDEVGLFAHELHNSLDGEYCILGTGWNREELIIDFESEHGQHRRVGVKLIDARYLESALNLAMVENHLLSPLVDVIHLTLVSLTGDPQNVRNFRARGRSARMLHYLPTAQEVGGEAA